jgi:hypothetical protein
MGRAEDVMSDYANIAAALAKFQAEIPTVAKGRTATVETRNGGSYKYTYAGLVEVTEAALPLLAKNGLSFSCCPRRSPSGDYDLIGVLLHESGEYLEGCLPIQGAKAQEIGSSITYNRRYLLGSMTGLITDDDDDGTLANQAPTRRAERSRGMQPDDQWTSTTGERPVLPMLDKTRARMFALFGEHHITDEDEQRRGISAIVGREVESRGSLTEGEAQAVIAVLAARPKPSKEADQ